MTTRPTTRGVAAVLRAAGHSSYAVDQRRRCPATGYELREDGDGVLVEYRTGRHGDDPRREETLTAWAAALSRWDVTREPDRLVVRGRVTP